MKLVLSVGIAIVAVALFVLFLRSRVAPTYRVTVDEVRQVLAQVQASKGDPTFAVFMFSTPDRPSNDDVLNIQFSLENGRAGFDWVLIAPRNVEDVSRFRGFATERGFSLASLEENGVKYLRVEGGDIAQLCMDVISVLYAVPRQTQVELITEGFRWTHDA